MHNITEMYGTDHLPFQHYIDFSLEQTRCVNTTLFNYSERSMQWEERSNGTYNPTHAHIATVNTQQACTTATVKGAPVKDAIRSDTLMKSERIGTFTINNHS